MYARYPLLFHAAGSEGEAENWEQVEWCKAFVCTLCLTDTTVLTSDAGGDIQADTVLGELTSCPL